MVQAYVLVQTRVGAAGRVARELGRLSGILVADPVTGPYDVVLRAQAPNLDELGRLIAQDVQSVEGITRTLTCVIPQSELG